MSLRPLLRSFFFLPLFIYVVLINYYFKLDYVTPSAAAATPPSPSPPSATAAATATAKDDKEPKKAQETRWTSLGPQTFTTTTKVLQKMTRNQKMAQVRNQAPNDDNDISSTGFLFFSFFFLCSVFFFSYLLTWNYFFSFGASFDYHHSFGPIWALQKKRAPIFFFFFFFFLLHFFSYLLTLKLLFFCLALLLTTIAHLGSFGHSKKKSTGFFFFFLCSIFFLFANLKSLFFIWSFF